MLTDMERLPLYYPEDAELYLRGGYLPNGSMLAAVFNLGFDPLEELPLCVKAPIASVKILGADGKQRRCSFVTEGKKITVHTPLQPLEPIVLILHGSGSET